MSSPNESRGVATHPQGGERTGNQQGTGDSRNTNADRSGNNRRNNRSRGGSGTPKFKGKCDDLTGHIYDVGAPNSAQDLFANTTREIAECAAREHTNAGEFGSGLPVLQLPATTRPARPAANDPIAFEEWKIELKEFKDKEQRRKTNEEKVFFLILGQCSDALRDRLESLDNWNDMLQDKDLIELLREIRTAMCQRVTNQAPAHSLIDAETNLHKFRQTENMSNTAYLEKLKSLVEVYEHAGGEPGMTQQRVANFTDLTGVDPNNAVAAAAAAAAGRAAAKDNYMATLLSLRSDPKRCGNLVNDIVNGFTRGTNEHPATLTNAHAHLTNFRGG